MKEIIILGAGGTGMDVVSIINSINAHEKTWKIIGFLDDNDQLIGKKIMGIPVIGKIENIDIYDNKYFISSIGHPTNRKVRKIIWEKMSKYKFATIIHPSAVIYDNVSIGDGTVVNGNCVLASNVHIGENVIMGYGCNIAHETIIEPHVAMGAGVSLSSGVVVGRGSYIGAGVSSTHGIKIEENTLVSVGAAIISDLKENSQRMWIGVPAITIKQFMKNKLNVRINS